MRENRQSGSEGGAGQTNAPSLPPIGKPQAVAERLRVPTGEKVAAPKTWSISRSAREAVPLRALMKP